MHQIMPVPGINEMPGTRSVASLQWVFTLPTVLNWHLMYLDFMIVKELFCSNYGFSL